MRLKDFFTVPAGEKVTEKSLYRVLVSSICSILLCMACLASTTWAWFAVSIENTGNIIAIAEITPSVEITAENQEPSQPEENGSYELTNGKYTIILGLDQEPSGNPDMQTEPEVYVVMTVQHGDTTECYYFAFADRGRAQEHTLAITDEKAAVSFAVSWVKPGNAAAADSDPITIGQIQTEPEAEEETTTPSTEETTEPSETESPTEETTEPPAAESATEETQ